MQQTAPRLAVWLALWLGCTACGDAGVAAIRLQLESDGSGVVTTSSLFVPEGPTPLEAQARGVEWTDRASLACSRGTFAALSELQIADIRFEVGQTGPGFHYLRVVLPRGKDARWPTVFTPSRAARRSAQQTFDPEGAMPRASSLLTIAIELPGLVVSHGVLPVARGLASDGSRSRATLTVPVDHALVAGPPFQWHITWHE